MFLSDRRVVQRNILILMEWYDHRIRQGIGRYARERGWHLTVDERSQIPSGWRGHGILTVVHRRRDIVAYLRRARLPVVDLGLYRPDIPMPRVAGDHARIGAMAAEHFAERGFRHVAWFSSSTSPIHALRFSGFRETCDRLGLGPPLRWVWEDTAAATPGDWSRERAWLERRLRSAPTPLAVWAHNDYDASKVSDVCRAAGIGVPDDVAILGTDNNLLVCLNQPVPLSSIAHDLARVGYEGAALLDRLIDGGPPPSSPVLIPPRDIALRQSTDLTAVDNPAIRRALRFIKDHLGRSFGVEQIAAAADVSRSTLDRLFQTHLNRSAHAEVRRARLAAVKQLIIHTDHPVAAIARMTGFCHPQYLNNVFRRAESMTPNAYRKIHATPPAETDEDPSECHHDGDGAGH